MKLRADFFEEINKIDKPLLDLTRKETQLKFLETYSLPTLNQEEIENLNKPITSKEIESVIKNLPTKNTPGTNSFTPKFYQIFNEELIKIHSNSSKYINK